MTEHGPWDVLFDVPGVTPFASTLAPLTETGTYVIANPRTGTLLRGVLSGSRGGRRVQFFATGAPHQRLEELAALLGAGRIRVVVDRRYPLAEAAEAHRYVESGAKHGNVVMQVD